jgi:hypothetical protein
MTRRGKTTGRALTKLAATLEEAEALAYARESVRMVRDEKILFLEQRLSWFEQADSRRLWKQWLRITAQDPRGLMDLCDDGLDGDVIAREALGELILEYRTARKDLPPQLGNYEMHVVRASIDPERRGRGRPKGDRPRISLRDLATVWVVGDLCATFGFLATRNTLSKKDHPSGCRIVALALEAEKLAIGESTVIGAWMRWGRHAFPPETLARLRSR